MAVPGLRTKKYKFSKRREVIASAEVALRQVQVVDKKGEVRALIVWQCGTDVLYADTMDGLFDSSRRKPAPVWLVDALNELPADRQFDAEGIQLGPTPVPEKVPDHIPAVDSDLPDFVQA